MFRHVSLTYNNPFQSRFCCLTRLEGSFAWVIVIKDYLVSLESLYSYKYLQEGKLSKSSSARIANTVKCENGHEGLRHKQRHIICRMRSLPGKKMPETRASRPFRKVLSHQCDEGRGQRRSNADPEPQSRWDSTRRFLGRWHRHALHVRFSLMLTPGAYVIKIMPEDVYKSSFNPFNFKIKG